MNVVSVKRVSQPHTHTHTHTHMNTHQHGTVTVVNVLTMVTVRESHLMTFKSKYIMSYEYVASIIHHTVYYTRGNDIV